jgi:hypothetical protein
MKKYLLLLTLLLAACSASADAFAVPPTPTAGITASPTITKTPLPTGTPTASPTLAATRTQTPLPSPTAEPTARRGGTISIFCLSVTQAIAGSDQPASEPISETLGRVLAGAGLNFIPDSDACDAVLQFDLTFFPKDYQYKIDGRDELVTCFTGAALRGTADLSWQGSSLYHRELQGEYVPIESTDICPEAHLAPFEYVWPAAAMKALAEVWGKNVIIPALMDPFQIVREAGADSLYLLSEPELLSFLPFLSTTLTDESEVVRLRVLEALQRAILFDLDAVSALSTEILQTLANERNPEAAQRSVDLLVSLAKNDGKTDEIVAGLRQILENSPPYPDGMTPKLMILAGIEKLGPLAVDTAPALITLLAEAEDVRYTENIRLVLKAVSGQDFGSDAAQWQAWWDQR